MSTHRIINLEAPLAATVSAIAEPLSVRQTDILDLIAQGRSNKEIARSLCIAPETVKTHVKHIFVKLNVEKRAQAVSRAYSLGLVGAYHNTTNRLGSPRVWNVEEPNAGFLPPLAPSRPRASDSKAGNLTRPLSATARHSSMCRGTITGGRVRVGGIPLRVNPNGAIDTRGEEVSDLSASAVIRRSGVVDNICGVAVASNRGRSVPGDHTNDRSDLADPYWSRRQRDHNHGTSCENDALILASNAVPSIKRRF